MHRRFIAIIPIVLVVIAVIMVGAFASIGPIGSHESAVPTLGPISEDLDDPDASEDAVSEFAPPDQFTAMPPRDGLGIVGNIIMYLFAAVAILIVTAGVGYVLYRVLTKPSPSIDHLDQQEASQPPTAEEIREALRAGLAHLEAGGDPRKVIIECWLSLEHVASESGVARLESQTPAELVERLLSRHEVDHVALNALANAYRFARYAPHDVDTELSTTAKDALWAVDSQLRDQTKRVEITP